MSTTFTFNPQSVPALIKQADIAVETAAQATLAESRRRVGVRGDPRRYPSGRGLPTGVKQGDQLRPSLHIERDGPGKRRVGSDLRYAIYNHNGTRPHPILPRKPGGTLSFFWLKTGTQVTFRRVNHPGTKANPFLIDGAIAAGLAVARTAAPPQ